MTTGTSARRSRRTPALRPSARELGIVRQMLSLPTAPFAEHFVIAHVVQFCRSRKGVTLTRDAAGNLLVRVRRGNRSSSRPVCITAHLDHPGFIADRMMDQRHVRCFWRGGVPKEYFVGAKVRFAIAADGHVPTRKSSTGRTQAGRNSVPRWRWSKPGRVVSIVTRMIDGLERVHTADIEVSEPIAPGTPAMWDFPEPVVKGSRILARACDDLAGAAAMLCAIDELSRSSKSCDAYFLFTRAEEVGFVGAIAAAKARTIPRKCFVVAMETSSERPFAKIGDGPILRVGDKASTFTHAATAYCHQVAKGLAAANPAFKFQRKLMDGGTCESSAYCTLGYEATGLCVALGNYHNIDAVRRKLGPEYVDLGDLAGVVQWFVALARSTRPYTGRDAALDDQMRRLESRWKKLLHATVP